MPVMDRAALSSDTKTGPAQQLQADFGELWVLIGGVHLGVLTLTRPAR